MIAPWARGRPTLAAAAVLLAAVLIAAPALAPWAEARVIHKERSLYSTILVDQRGSLVCLQFSVRRDQRNQSCYDQRQPRAMQFPYVRMMMASLLLNPDPDRVLILGLGGGTLPMALNELWPETPIDVVEIDPAVTRVAREFFGFAPNDQVEVHTQDARVFVKRAAQRGQRYDLVMLDAFNGEYIPEHLMTREFIEEAASLLTPDGALAANTFSLSELYDHESATYAAVFDRFYNLKDGTSGNRVVLATDGPLPSKDVMAQRARALAPALERYAVDLRDYLPRMSTRRDWDTDARVLTDQYSPANLLQGG